jgi:hypothetical protein
MGKVLRDYLSFDFERGGEFAGFNAEFLRKNCEPAYLFHPGIIFHEQVKLLIVERNNLRLFNKVFRRVKGNTMLISIVIQFLEIRYNQCAKVFLSFANYD